jgi:hypothetical protein
MALVPRRVALHVIHSVVPIKKHEFTVFYMNDDGTKTFTDRYKMGDGKNCDDWIKDGHEIINFYPGWPNFSASRIAFACL